MIPVGAQPAGRKYPAATQDTCTRVHIYHSRYAGSTGKSKSRSNGRKSHGNTMPKKILAVFAVALAILVEAVV